MNSTFWFGPTAGGVGKDLYRLGKEKQQCEYKGEKGMKMEKEIGMRLGERKRKTCEERSKAEMFIASRPAEYK